MDQKSELSSILEHFNRRDSMYPIHDISSALRDLRKKVNDDGKEVILDLKAEELAFNMFAGGGERSNWGTYYGPMFVGTSEDGTVIEYPGRSHIDEYVITYWRSRPEFCSNLIMINRYSDLLWDFSSAERDGKRNIDDVLRVIDSTISILREWKLTELHQSVQLAKRAIELSLSTNKLDRVVEIADELISLEELSLDVNPEKIWGFSYDILMNQQKLVIPESLNERIIAILEMRLNRYSAPEGCTLDPHGIETAVEKLVEYYRRNDDKINLRRVLITYKTAYVEISKCAAPLVAEMWLRKVYGVLHQNGLHKEADELESVISETGKRAKTQLKTISTTFEIPKEKIDSFLRDSTPLDADDAFCRFVGQFVPDKDNTEKQLKESAREAPLQSLLTFSVLGSDGMTIANIGPIHEDMNGRMIHQSFQNMQFETLWMDLLIDHILSKYEITTEYILDRLYKSPCFVESWRSSIEMSLIAYYSKLYPTCCCLLIPSIEQIIRRTMSLIGGVVYKRNRQGGFDVRSLDDVLRDTTFESFIGESTSIYLRSLLTDKRGWNIRNAICHGLRSIDSFGKHEANRLIHVLLLFGMLRSSEQ